TGNEQVVEPLPTQGREMFDRLVAARRMEAGVDAVFVLWEVTGLAAAEIEQRIVALADDEDGRVWRERRPGDVLHALDERTSAAIGRSAAASAEGRVEARDACRVARRVLQEQVA